MNIDDKPQYFFLFDLVTNVMIQVLYYPISLEHTNFHSLYGEAIQKTFLSPVRVYALIVWQGYNTETTNLGVASQIFILDSGIFSKKISKPNTLSVLKSSFLIIDG